ncbi:hypothetical protein [Candidatus Thiodubiliella endoseptemdiera]|uniref:hypothetical protein n=1 Tax=Candidatus Thiodubiliella endoseptemdiera TaxID=2738886 RepID=UPI0034DDFCF7
MNEKENKKSIIKRLSKWITKLDTLLGGIRNIVLVIIAITLMVIASNSQYLREIYFRSIDVRVINTPDVDVTNFPSSISVDNLYEISR